MIPLTVVLFGHQRRQHDGRSLAAADIDPQAGIGGRLKGRALCRFCPKKISEKWPQSDLLHGSFPAGGGLRPAGGAQAVALPTAADDKGNMGISMACISVLMYSMQWGMAVEHKG